MKPAITLHLAGWISMVVLAALTSPGVRAVRADEARPRPGTAFFETSEGPTCSAAETPGTIVVPIALPSGPELAAAEAAGPRPRVISLDGRGDRYGAPPQTLPDQDAR